MTRRLQEERRGTAEPEEGVLERRGPSLPELVQHAMEHQALMSELLGEVNVPRSLIVLSSTRIQQEAINDAQLARTKMPSARNDPYLASAAARIIAHSTYNVDEQLSHEIQDTPVLADHLISVAAQTNAPLVTVDTELAREWQDWCDCEIWRIDDSESGLPAYVMQLDCFVEKIINRSPFDLSDVPIELLDRSVRALRTRP